jgi:NAD(P)H-quinone oxidoreductase subunit 1
MTSTIAIDQKIINFLVSLGLPKPISEFVWLCIPILVVLGSTLGVLVIVWLERKYLQLYRQRIGPEYAGPLGIIQALLDGLKLILKEDIIPSKGDSWLFTIGPAIVVIPIVLSYLVVPFGPNLIVADIGLGIFFGLLFLV